MKRSLFRIRHHFARLAKKGKYMVRPRKCCILLAQSILYLIIKSRRAFGCKEWFGFNLIYYFYCHINSNKKRSKVNHNALWSEDRSGNHWVRFIAEYLTGHPTQGVDYDYRDIPIYMNTFPSEHHPLTHVNRTAPYILYKSHFPYRLTDDSTILLLIRDFHEHFARVNDPGRRMMGIIRSYISLIKAYDNFLGPKMIIYYEDLILNPEKEILRIKYFLGASDERYKAFMNRYDYYSEISRQGKRRMWGKSNSGTDIKFFRKQTNKKVLAEKLEQFYRLIADPKNQLVKPYISRYM